MVYEPELSYCYFKREDSYAKAEDIGDGSSEKHLPLNLLMKFNPPGIKYIEEEYVAFSDMGPTEVYNPEYLQETTSNEAIFKGIFFMLAAVFPHKTVTASWTGTGDEITGDFTDTDNVNTLSVNMHIHDASGSANHIDKTYIGTLVTQYGWKIDRVGGLMLEFWDWQCADIRDNAQAPDIDDNLDDALFNRTGVDGGHDDWDTHTTTPIQASALTITKNNAALSGVHIETFQMTIDLPVKVYNAQSSRVAVAYSRQPRKFTFEADVLVTDETYLTQLYTLYASKAVDTFKLQYGTTKYIQCTNTAITEFKIEGIPAAGEAVKAHLRIEGRAGAAISFYWQGNVVQDPSAYISHT